MVMGIAAACADPPVDKPVTKKDPALDALVSSDAKLEEISTGYGFTEGLVWVAKGKSGYLLLSDMPANVIYTLSTDGKQKSLYLDRSGYTGFDIWRVGFMQTNGRSKDDPRYEEFAMIGSNGLALDREGRLVIATWAGRGIDRIEKNGKRVTLTDNLDGKKFNGTNDLVVKNDGAIYFTDDTGGLRLRDQDRSAARHRFLGRLPVEGWQDCRGDQGHSPYQRPRLLTRRENPLCQRQPRTLRSRL
jgi:gluconolactonase